MKRTSFKKDLSKALLETLPGEKGQAGMAPEFRGEISSAAEPLQAAVMILLFPLKTDTGIVFIKRNTYNGPHSAQVSFPGGAWETGDVSQEETAIRECREELGIQEDMLMLGSLTRLHIPVSNFMVTPFVAWMNEAPVFQPDPLEVEYVIESSLGELSDPTNILFDQWEQHGRRIAAPYYRVGKEKIWGATAMMLCEFLQVVSRLQQHRA
jgi:8-oxo-dGTP pyrophosphatase MutT (NUDIX family)